MASKIKDTPRPWAYPLFSHMSSEHGLTLLESELAEIIHVVDKMRNPEPDGPTWWANVYEDDGITGGIYESKEEARDHAVTKNAKQVRVRVVPAK